MASLAVPSLPTRRGATTAHRLPTTHPPRSTTTPRPTTWHQADRHHRPRCTYRSPAARWSEGVVASKSKPWPTGPAHPHFGMKRSAKARRNISEGRKGKAIGNQNWKKRLPFTQDEIEGMRQAALRRWDGRRSTPEQLATAREKKRIRGIAQGVRRRARPGRRLFITIRVRIWKVCKRIKRPNLARHLGYTGDQLRAHIEMLFTPEMSWANYGSIWHVDHIRPVASFVLPKQMKQCWALANLRPLSGAENMQKGTWWDGSYWRNGKRVK